MNVFFNQLCGALLAGLINGSITVDNLRDNYQETKTVFSRFFVGQTVDDEQVINHVLASYEVFVGEPAFLDNDKDHIEWLHDQKPDIAWNYWNRYRQYLNISEKLPPAVIEDIHRRTDDILGRLEDPKRKGNWDRRGMVIGNVQSGKTGNYIGLICKAVDAGYKVIIVLAGLNNDLRRQTQLRIDSGFVGRDSEKKDNYDQTSSRIGAGLYVQFPVPPVTTITTSAMNGDYRKGAHSVTPTIGGDPIIAVVKKNVTPLKNLINLFQSYNTSGIIPNVPLLLIDDEADNASIDTKSSKKIGTSNAVDDETDPTKINGQIRQILGCFSQSAYVGYTATPFANMFIYPGEKEGFGEDLFPRSFACILEAPSNYMGPEQLFGLYSDPIAGIEERRPYPLIRRISDYESIFVPKHKKDLTVNSLPKSLYHAMAAFILTICVRNVRGYGKEHQSMLVHVTRFVNVQRQVRELISEWKNTAERCLEMKTGPQYEALHASLKQIWEEDFVPTMKEMKEIVHDQMCTDVNWDDIEPLLYRCTSKIQVKEINGKAFDGGLNYDENPNGLYVIAIGGDKLSRGLTLSGLSISYYIRTSKMYDTLMQMGRWFGYRDGYVDVCRLYTSAQLADWYQHIAVANLELRNEFRDMAAMNSDPAHYGIRVRTHPNEMVITALNKMKNSMECKVTYSGKLVQIPRYYRNNPVNEQNIKFTEQWLNRLGAPTDLPSEKTYWNYLWRDVKPEAILEFLHSVKIHSTCFEASPDVTGRYIQALNEADHPELIHWTVEVVSNRRGTPFPMGSITINPTWRSDANEGKDDEMVSMKQESLITESHQAVDLSKEEKAAAYEATLRAYDAGLLRTKKRPEHASPKYMRMQRKPENGLLIIQVFQSGINEEEKYDEMYLGYAISFPQSRIAKEVSYKVDEVYWNTITSDSDY